MTDQVKSDQVKYKCDRCDYSTIVKSNLKRHQKSCHKNQQGIPVVPPNSPMLSSSSSKKKVSYSDPTEEHQDDDDDEIDMEDYINQRISTIMKNRGGPTNVKLPSVKSLMTSTFASGLFGFVIGTMVYPMVTPFVMQMLKKKTTILPPPSAIPTTPATTPVVSQELPVVSMEST